MRHLIAYRLILQTHNSGPLRHFELNKQKCWGHLGQLVLKLIPADPLSGNKNIKAQICKITIFELMPSS